jgi:hypothetical protein
MDDLMMWSHFVRTKFIKTSMICILHINERRVLKNDIRNLIIYTIVCLNNFQILQRKKERKKEKGMNEKEKKKQ